MPANGLLLLMKDVADFHRAAGQPVLTVPQWPDEARVALRAELIGEEMVRETVARLAPDAPRTPEALALVADGIIDAIYVLVGTLLELGLPGDKVWELVQNANMAKIDPVTGYCILREDGKVLKPDGWVSPDGAILDHVKKLMKAGDAAKVVNTSA